MGRLSERFFRLGIATVWLVFTFVVWILNVLDGDWVTSIFLGVIVFGFVVSTARRDEELEG